jgi:hypothetical protein
MEQSHSRVGIVSLVIAVLSGIGMCCMMTFAATQANNAEMTEDSPMAIALGLMLLGDIFFALVGIGFGVAGFFAQERKKLFPVLGTILNTVTVVAIVFVIILGLMMPT